MSSQVIALFAIEAIIGLMAGVLAFTGARAERKRLVAKFAPYTMRDES